MTNKQFVEENINLIRYISNEVGKKLSREDREDLIQDTIVKILESNEDDIRQPSAYINQVMIRTLMNKVRDNRTDAMGYADSLDQPKVSEEEMYTLYDIVPASRTDDNEDYSETANSFTMYKDDIDAMCIHLTEQRSKLFKMRYFLGMTPKEIAADLGIKVHAVSITLTRAVADARSLTTTVTPLGYRYEGCTLQEMALATLPDEIYYPFKLYYTNSKSVMDIIEMTGQSFDAIKRSISLGERMIHERYGLDVRKR